MHSSVALSTFTLSCNCPHHPSPGVFHLPRLKLCPHETLTPHTSPSPSPHHLLPVSVDVTPPGTSCEWNRTVFVLLCLRASLSITFSRFVHIVAGVRISFSFYLNLFLFLAALGLCCCLRAFSSCGERGLLFVGVRGLLIAVASRCGARALGKRASVLVALGLYSAGSVVVAYGLSCSAACGIFLDQGSKPCPLHWQVDS